MIINSVLLWFTFRTIKSRAVWYRVLLSASIGTGFAMMLPLISLSGFWGSIGLISIKVFIGAFMVFVACWKTNPVRQILFFLIFAGYTFALGGAIYGLTFATQSVESSILFFTQNSSIPIGFFVGTAFIGGILLSKLIKFLNVRHSINNYLRDCVITMRGNKFRITSYLDTGNRLVDPKTGAPVVIITMSLFLKMFPDVTADRILLQKLGLEIEDGRYIDFSTIDRSAKMFTFTPTMFEIIDKKSSVAHSNVRLGVSMKGFKDAVKYDALLNANLV